MQRLAQGYSGRHGFVVSRRQKVRRKTADKPNRLWLWKLVGTIITLAMICGVSGTFFVGLKIRNSLDELSTQKQKLVQVEKENNQLQSEKKTVMSKEYVEALAAVRLGLYAPSAGSNDGGEVRIARP